LFKKLKKKKTGDVTVKKVNRKEMLDKITATQSLRRTNTQDRSAPVIEKGTNKQTNKQTNKHAHTHIHTHAHTHTHTQTQTNTRTHTQPRQM